MRIASFSKGKKGVVKSEASYRVMLHRQDARGIRGLPAPGVSMGDLPTVVALKIGTSIDGSQERCLTG